MNPHVSGDVVVTWSSNGNASISKVEYFVKNQLNNQYSLTQSVPGSWMMVDLRNNQRISPNHYSLRHDKNNRFFPRNWVLEGKMDDLDNSAWVVLREHVSDNSLNRPGATCSWPVTNFDHDQCFRYIRIRITGVDSNGSHYLECSGIELYEDLLLI
jgi:hypothetical protein